MGNEIPPFCIEAEEAILGGCLLDPQAISLIKDYLHVNAFYATAHKEIYDAMLRLHDKGKPTDLISVANWLEEHNQLTYVGGRTKLLTLLDNAVTSINIDAIAELVMEKYLRRELIKAGNQIVQLGHDPENELPVILDKAQQKIFNISNLNFRFTTEHNNEIVNDAYEELKQTNHIYSTGLKDLDKLMVGLEPGTLTVVAGRASMGKSFIATNLALQIMLLHKLPVAIFSLEMTKNQLEYRLWSMISVHEFYASLNLLPLESDRIRRHRGGREPLKEEEFANIDKIVAVARELPLYINDSRKISVAAISSACRQILARQGLGLVIIDYLQMMAEDSDANRSYSLGNVARAIYQMSGDLNNTCCITVPNL
jgi:replicative DNA helicase